MSLSQLTCIWTFSCCIVYFFKQNLKIHNFSNIHRHIRVPVRKQCCSSWDQTGFLTTRRSGADTWLTWCLDFPRCRPSFWESERISQSAFPNWGEHFTFSLSQLFSNCRTCFPWAAVMYFVSCFFTFGVPLPYVYERFVLSFVLCFLFVLVSRFCCRSCFSKNVFFLKMSFHLVWLTNLMVLMFLMMMLTCWPSRYHAVQRF